MIPPQLPKIKTYWWKGKNRPPNWGDWLTPLVLSRFAHVEAQWSERGSADLVSIGSLLGNIVGPWYTGTILGSGKLFENGIVPPRAKILALRGPLTAKGVPGNFVLGDPGLLADELVKIDTKRFDLCIIPHWSDKKLGKDERFTRYNHVVVDSAAPPLEVLSIIAQSKKVVSSSLHGLILADAFNLPRRFEDTADWSREGESFKVKDHNATMGLPFLVGQLQEVAPHVIIEVKSDLKQVFRAYGKEVWRGNG